jgi:hypothetical protein
MKFDIVIFVASSLARPLLLTKIFERLVYLAQFQH